MEDYMNRLTVGFEVAATTVAVAKDAKVEATTNVTTETAATTETAVAEEKVETEAVAEENVETEAVVEGEVTTEEVVVDEAAVAGDATTGVNTEVVYEEGMYAEDGTFVDPTMQTGMVEIKDPLLSSWPFVIGVSFAVLFVSIVLGALLAKRKIKKGIELYED